ncbi:MAG: hypothetical protein IT385_16610 [Deltaproteobacteria bacterium]|nr:hypothetical protein [Deltaproteobacteria bacterium]
MRPDRRSPRARLPAGGLVIALASALVASPARAQERPLPGEVCTVQILNQTSFVQADGSWIMPALPAGGGRVRARLECVDRGGHRRGQSRFFDIAPNMMSSIAPITFAEPEPGPTRIAFTTTATRLTAVGATLDLGLVGVYADGREAPLPGRDQGTSYWTTDPAVARVSLDGVVTAQASGAVLVTAVNEGVTTTLRLVIETGPDQDADGLPDDWEVRWGLDPRDPLDARIDRDLDGLIALEEFLAGTDPSRADSDGDRLGDAEEVAIGADGWVTSPVLLDTDGDRIPDGVEGLVGTDPTSPASVDYDASLDGLLVRPGAVQLVYDPAFGEASAQLAVTGLLIDGTGVDLTDLDALEWSVADTRIAFVASDRAGLVVAGGEGATDLTVSVATHVADISIVVRVLVSQPLSRLDLGCPGNGVALDVTRALVACGTKGLELIALSPAGSPRRTGGLTLGGAAWDLALDGETAYVLLHDGRLAVVAVPRSGVPSLVTTLTLEAQGVALARAGSLLAVAAAGGRVHLVDVATPSAPSHLGTIAVGAEPLDVALSGDRLVAALADGTLATWSVAAPDAPVAGPTTPVAGARGLAFTTPDTLAVATGNSGLALVALAPDLAAVTPVSTLGAQQFMLEDVAADDTLVFGADYFRVNAVPIVQARDPAAPRFVRAIDFSAWGDHNGARVTAGNGLVAMVGVHGTTPRTRRETGQSTLFIGQYGAVTDPFGQPPSCVITTPATLSTAFHDQVIGVSVSALDDVAVLRTELYVDGVPVATDPSAPYDYTLKLPDAGDSVMLQAFAMDTAGSVGACAPVLVALVPDPGTTVVGQVVNIGGLPFAGAVVAVDTIALEVTAGDDGRFTLAGVPTWRPFALYVEGQTGEVRFRDRFGPWPPVPDGITDVGALVLARPYGVSTGSALVARPLVFLTHPDFEGFDEGFFASGPVTARAVAFWTTPFASLDGEVPLGPVLAQPVSFRVNDWADTPGERLAIVLAATPVSFRVTDWADTPGERLAVVLAATPLGFATHPIVTGVDPELASRAAATATFTLVGDALADVTSVRFALNGAVNTKVAATGLALAPDASSLTVTASIAADAPLGRWAVQVVAPAGASSARAEPHNSFELQP